MENAAPPVQCDHGEECGACALLGNGYAEQLEHKREILERALAKHTLLRGTRTLPCLPSPLVERYRNRAKMAIGMSGSRGTRVGYFRAGTREVVNAPGCRVLIPELLDSTCRIRRFLQKGPKIPRELRHIDLRCGSDPRRQHLTLVFRATELPKFPFDILRKNCPAVDGISINLNATPGPQVIRGSVRHVWGGREIWVDHAGLRLRVSPGAFFQVNLTLLPAIHESMQDFFQNGEVLADLYAGVGTHGLALHGKFRRVLFAEGNRSAVADLKSTLAKKGIEDVRISPRAVERGLDLLVEEAPDAVVLNPSRAGVLEPVLEAIARCPVSKVAYLSCDPTTLCRDLESLRRKGFAIQSIQPIDMMPQTRQVEALALLTRPQRRPAASP